MAKSDYKKGDLVEINESCKSVYAGYTGEFIADCKKTHKACVFIEDLGLLFFNYFELTPVDRDLEKELREANCEIQVLSSYKKQADKKINDLTKKLKELKLENEKLREVVSVFLNYHDALTTFEAEYGTQQQLINKVRQSVFFDDGLLDREYTVKYFSNDCAEEFHTAFLRPEQIELLELGSEVKKNGSVYVIRNKTRTCKNNEYTVYNILCQKVS
jgi:hypothetical protein